MRWVEVDERTPSWERADARYRVHVYAGADLGLTTTDVLDATVEQALEAAHTLAFRDEHLWSLALVEQDAEGRDGLVWLSGMDYRQIPTTQAQWRIRGRMQDRLLSARRPLDCPAVLPNGLRVIRMFVDWSVRWPLWETHGEPNMPTPHDLGLSVELGDALEAWSAWWNDRPWDAELPRADAWVAEGLSLHAALQAELDGVAEVRREFGP